MRLHIETHRDAIFIYGKSWDITALEGGTATYWGDWMRPL
jgi:hypothetical protein